MIKIGVKQVVTDDDYDSDDYYYDIDAEIKIPEDATGTQALYAFIKALEIEGYNKVVIERSLTEIYEELTENGTNG